MENKFDRAQTLNKFFSNIVSNSRISEYANCDPISENINEEIIKSIVKYRNHISLFKVGEVCNRRRESLFFLFACR